MTMTMTGRMAVGLVGLLLCVGAGFGAGLLTSAWMEEEPDGRAPERTRTLVAENFDAFEAADSVAATATYTGDAVFTAVNGDGDTMELVGPGEIWAAMGASQGLRTTSELVQQGGLVLATYTEAFSTGVVAFAITDGRISHQWFVIEELLDPGAVTVG